MLAKWKHSELSFNLECSMSGHLKQNVSDQCLLCRSLKLNHEKSILLQWIPMWNHFYWNILHKFEIKDKEGGLIESF